MADIKILRKGTVFARKNAQAQNHTCILRKKRTKIRKNNGNASEVFVPGILIICIIMHSKLPNALFELKLLDERVNKNGISFNDFIIREKGGIYND